MGTTAARRAMATLARTGLIMLATTWVACLGAERAGDTRWPGDSLHRLGVRIETASGAETSLAGTGGNVRIATMFYSSCPVACPLIIKTVQDIEGQLSEAERAQLRVLLITFDPDRDTPRVLSALQTARRLDTDRWTLARTTPADVRTVAAALDIPYRKLDDGSFMHANVLVLLDATGRVLARSSKMGVPDPEFVAAVRSALADQSGGRRPS